MATTKQDLIKAVENLADVAGGLGLRGSATVMLHMRGPWPAELADIELRTRKGEMCTFRYAEIMVGEITVTLFEDTWSERSTELRF